MERELEKTLMEIDHLIKEHEERGNTHTQSVLEQERDIISMCAQVARTPSELKEIIHKHMDDDWIPVEERLPETGEHVLVSFRDDGFLPAVAIIQEDGKWLMLQGAKGFNDVTDDVTAWQPLPEQYRPERSE